MISTSMTCDVCLTQIKDSDFYGCQRRGGVPEWTITCYADNDPSRIPPEKQHVCGKACLHKWLEKNL